MIPRVAELTGEVVQDDSEDAMPMHTYCFELFKGYGRERFGFVNINSLFSL